MLKPWTWQVEGEVAQASSDFAAALADATQAARPLVMRGLARAWPLVRAASDGAAAAFAHLMQFDRGENAKTMLGAPELGGRFFYADDMLGYNFAVETVPLSRVCQQVLAMADDPDPPAIYAGSNPVDAFLPGFSAANPLPLPIPAVIARVWIGNASHVAPHFDVSENIAVVALGRRRVTLFPPDQTRNLYVGPLDVTIAGQPVSMVDIRQPDLARFPRYAHAMAAAVQVDLGPGDALYMPTLWWHCIEALDPANVLVNYWYNAPANSSPFAALVHAMLAVRDLPPTEKDAWRHWFDHFVFDPAAAEAASHLPPHARGVSGPPGPARAQGVRSFIARALGLR
ncbi:MAG: cupin-like domain-containing protein [Novosphingobium sp.]|nr:cupin-like domain-containing protein [Novosphingobium sp.]